MEQNSLFASPADRRAAYRQLMLTDHGFLRAIWTHEYEIAPGVWRSNQPSPRRIARWAARGLKSVLLLRGKTLEQPIPMLEAEACTRHGLTLHCAPVSGGTMTRPNGLMALFEAFDTVERPFVMHCKSGIDRTGFAAFLYLVDQTDIAPEIARRQLSFKYLHLNTSRHGILDFMADAFLAAHRDRGVSLRDWVASEYDPVALTARYRSGEAPI